jgi:hypothetical protein
MYRIVTIVQGGAEDEGFDSACLFRVPKVGRSGDKRVGWQWLDQQRRPELGSFGDISILSIRSPIG